MKAFFAYGHDTIEADGITAMRLHTRGQHYSGKLRLTAVVAIAPKRSSFQAFVGKIQMQRCLVFGSVVFIAAITYGTLTRVGLPYAPYFKLAPWLGHPSMHVYAAIEHFVVFVILGVLLSSAFPGRTLVVCCVIILGASLLEYLQTLTVDRHGTVLDACEKIAGGLAGVLAVRAGTRWRSMRDQSLK